MHLDRCMLHVHVCIFQDGTDVLYHRYRSYSYRYRYRYENLKNVSVVQVQVVHECSKRFVTLKYHSGIDTGKM